ncbi:MAG TPA: NAD(P)H-dependent oxidoreductase [Chthoniobacterales bacterium]|nr:NAD(P)H-dependent oxidoreductase [Chthoniobacterales bacterium]
MPNHLVISTSGNPDSNSRRMGREAFKHLQNAGVSCEWLDIAELDLPLCNADTCYTNEGARQLNAKIKWADGILVATPIYNYDVSATAKNMVELSGSGWEEKVVGFLCAAGGMSSYMSLMSFANSLMLDFRSVIVPRFVYATGQAFEGEDVKDAKIAARIEQLAGDLVRFTQALRG